MNWYKILGIHQKLALKELCFIICGMKQKQFNCLFTPREKIEILYEKLQLKEFDI